MSKLIHYNTIELDKIYLHNPLLESDKVICELSYDKLEPFMFFIDTLKVIKFTNDEIILDLRNNDHIKNLFNDIDEKIVAEIQTRQLVKNYGLKKFTYIPLINNYTNNNNETFDVLKLKVNLFGDYKTALFFKYDKPIHNLSIMQTDITVKTIFECINLTFDKVSKLIYLDNCVRQIKVKQLKPTRVKNLDYSFVDSDDEKVNDNNVEDDKKNKLDKIYELSTDNNNDIDNELIKHKDIIKEDIIKENKDIEDEDDEIDMNDEDIENEDDEIDMNDKDIEDEDEIDMNDEDIENEDDEIDIEDKDIEDEDDEIDMNDEDNEDLLNLDQINLLNNSEIFESSTTSSSGENFGELSD
jgi:hypothetical protein